MWVCLVSFVNTQVTSVPNSSFWIKVKFLLF